MVKVNREIEFKGFKCSSQVQLPEILRTTCYTYKNSQTHSCYKELAIKKFLASVSQLFLQFFFKQIPIPPLSLFLELTVARLYQGTILKIRGSICISSWLLLGKVMRDCSRQSPDCPHAPAFIKNLFPFDTVSCDNKQPSSSFFSMEQRILPVSH